MKSARRLRAVFRYVDILRRWLPHRASVDDREVTIAFVRVGNRREIYR